MWNKRAEMDNQNGWRGSNYEKSTEFDSQRTPERERVSVSCVAKYGLETGQKRGRGRGSSRTIGRNWRRVT